MSHIIRIAVLVTATAGLVATAPAALAQPTLPWTTCTGAGVPPGMECAGLDVPVDWAKPGGAKITLQLARARATGHRKGSVITIPGGPGGSGVEDLKSSWNAYADLRREFDVIGFAPRGSWGSGHLPAECDDPNVSLTIPRNKADYDAAVSQNRTAIERCRSGAPEVFDHLDSASHARDVEAIRVALGDKDFNGLALSYGGVVATTYARLFPKRVRTLFLDGVVDHVRPYSEARRDSYTNVEEFFGRFVKWCQDDTACSLRGKDIPEMWRALVAKADRTPIPVAGTQTAYTGGELQIAASPFLAAGRFQLLADAIAKAANGDASGFGAPLGGRKPAGPAASVAVECGDGLPGFTDHADFKREMLRGKELSRNFPVAGLWRQLQCTGWHLPVANPRTPLTGLDLPPVLAAGTLSDSDGGRAIAGQVRGSSVIKVESFGHGLYGHHRNPCVIDHVDTYFSERRLPPTPTTCPA
ncbi:alpha/beta hydrolase [Allokutzneria sp. A3M-2-11 16]|uniref:alpha/beta fold hydrolase n=1 Tax=Allokutzneria sp. A3M-2-11 16 TaxID=2962043 RepID=UPI0020B7E386|nr:alpha/beta fold hydrolase [Allokutzneria sp. A3M-2-11 16]MCP3799195.1 alpha/beta hydrolase [Allokutzneria sp. A3M-2-11 16]